ncbi:MAG: AtpZ/AtpI family protein [Cyclobacteriaceae bacterium]
MENQSNKHPSSKPNPEPDHSYAKLSGITFELLSLNLIIIGGGYYLNEFVDPAFPWLLLLSTFLSVAATIFYLLKKFGS